MTDSHGESQYVGDNISDNHMEQEILKPQKNSNQPTRVKSRKSFRAGRIWLNINKKVIKARLVRMNRLNLEPKLKKNLIAEQ